MLGSTSCEGKMPKTESLSEKEFGLETASSLRRCSESENLRQRESEEEKII